MFLFLRLLLAHFIADFPFQTTAVYIIKVRGKHGLWLHTSIIFVMSVLFVYPYWSYPSMWVYLLGSTLIHHASDAVKLVLNKRGSHRNYLLRYVGDQVVHIATAASVLLLPISGLRIEGGGPEFWTAFYNSDFWVLYGSLIILATYFATYFIEALKKSYYPERFQEILPEEYKIYGIIERACLFNLAFLGPIFWIFIPLAVLPRTILVRILPQIFKDKMRATSILEISCTLLLGIIPGLALRFLTLA